MRPSHSCPPMPKFWFRPCYDKPDSWDWSWLLTFEHPRAAYTWFFSPERLQFVWSPHDRRTRRLPFPCKPRTSPSPKLHHIESLAHDPSRPVPTCYSLRCEHAAEAMDPVHHVATIQERRSIQRDDSSSSCSRQAPHPGYLASNSACTTCQTNRSTDNPCWHFYKFYPS